MTFSNPYLLFLLPLAMIVLRRQQFNAVRVPSLRGWYDVGESRRIRWFKRMRFLRFLAFSFLIIAFASPVVERPVEETVRQGVAIEMLVDISSSMDCSITSKWQKKQTRMEAAKKAVQEFINARENDLIGLITFARYPDTISPLTFGHKALSQLVGNIEIQDRPNEDGTAYGDALMQACAQLKQMSEWQGGGSEIDVIKSKVVVLLTDGENNCGRHLPQEAAGMAEKWNIRVYVLSLREPGESGKLSDAESLLKIVADSTGGCFWEISDEQGLDKAYDAIDKLEKSRITDSTVVHNEPVYIFPLFLIPAVILLLLDMVIGATLLHLNQEVVS